MKPTRLVEWALVVASLSAVAINVWVTPRALGMPLNLARWVLFAIAALLGLAAQTSRAGAVKVPWGSLQIIMFVGIAYASIIWSLAPRYTFARAVSVSLLMIGVFVFGAGGSALAGGGLLVTSMVGINLAIVATSVAMLPLSAAWDSSLYRGPFGNPNGLGAALLLTLPFVIGKAFSIPGHGKGRRDRRWRLALRAATVLTLGLMLLTRSRTAIMTVIIVALLFALVIIRQKVEAVIVGGFLLGLTFALVPAEATRPVVTRYVYKGQENDILFSRRENLQTTFDMAKERPWFGHGFGVAADTMPGQAWSGGLTTPLGFGREKTNSYLGLIEEVGLVGLLPLLVGLGYGTYRAARRLASVRWSDPIGMALLASVLSGLVHVNGEAWLTSAGSLEAFWFWWTAGVLFSPSFWRHARPRLVRNRR